MQFDTLIIGGGIVGVATALKILEKEPNLNVAVVEKENVPGYHQTGHNSGVIHSGIYYKPGSLKAENCTRGYQMLVDFCEQEGVPYELCGKVIVATEEWELPILERIFNRGKENGLTNIQYLGPEEIREKEPNSRGIQGIWVPYTGIVDYKKVAQQIATKFTEKGGTLITGESVQNLERTFNEVSVTTNQAHYSTKLLVNCAGLYSDKIARMTHPDIDYRIIPFRGEYYKLKPEAQHLIKNLIYPVPDPNFPFLGVHFTREIDGSIEAGPNAVFAFSREGYTKSNIKVGETLESLSWPGFQKVLRNYWQTGVGELYRSFSKSAFTKALQKLVPAIREEHLTTGGAGVRAQACDRNGGLVDDFVIYEDEGVVHVLNAPSPAATSALSIGDTVAQKGFKAMKS